MKIFSRIKNDDSREIKFLGVTLFKYKKNFNNLFLSQIYRYQFDITTVPPAMGILRDIQLAGLIILKEVDRVCKKHNITYWADFGALLGAFRHKGFIPWDDDVDIAMLRDDYERFVGLFNAEAKSDFYAEFFYSSTCNIIKIRHQKINFISVDIFVHDLYHSKINSADERCALTKKIQKIQNTVYLPQSKRLSNDKKYELLRQLDKKMVMEGKVGNPADHPDIYLGLDSASMTSASIFYGYDDIFPLKTMVYEDMEIPVPNNPDRVLTYMYRDYMAYPSRLTPIHLTVSKLSLQDIEDLKDFVAQG